MTARRHEQAVAVDADELGIDYWTLHSRVRRGWSDTRILGGS